MVPISQLPLILVCQNSTLTLRFKFMRQLPLQTRCEINSYIALQYSECLNCPLSSVVSKVKEVKEKLS